MAVHHLLLLLIILLLSTINASELCQQSCGGIRILYPFGIGEGCYYNKWFEVTCSSTSGSPKTKALLKSFNMEIWEDIYYSTNSVGIKIPAPHLNCTRFLSPAASDMFTHLLAGSPFSLSNPHNRLIAIGCDEHAMTNQSNSTTAGGCLSTCTCDPAENRGGCNFVCSIPQGSKLDNTNASAIFPTCKFAFLADHAWLESNSLTNKDVLKYDDYVPARIEWGKKQGRCLELFNSDTICNVDDFCLIKLNSGHFCVCDDQRSPSYQGCAGTLICNTTSGYNCSECPGRYNSKYDDDQSKWCSSSRSFNEMLIKNSKSKSSIIMGCSAGLGIMLILIGACWFYKFIKRRKAIKLKQKLFKRNGGLLLQQHLSGNCEKMKLFTSKELEMATDNYNKNRILGQGGHGVVYKGMLAEGRIVAIKKSKMVDESKLEEFINEVVILSQINHRNIVQLLGCCLETQVPLLVYEFIPNGTLYQHIHDRNEEFPITWELRLRIATEVAYALSYLHSSTSTPIYHRDIKSTNILLDENYQAKVSDFGTSRFVALDQTHLTTQVQGTFGYLDPEYFQSCQFTDKSDVYSLGVVLAEILTGQKSICSIKSKDDRSLATYFLSAMKENRLFEILDDRVSKEGGKEEIMIVANLTKRCLNLNGKKRPTMRDVSSQLAGVRVSIGASMQQNYKKIDSVNSEIANRFKFGSTLTTGTFVDCATFPIDNNRLISHTW